MVLQVSKTSSSFSLSTALQAARFGRKMKELILVKGGSQYDS